MKKINWPVILLIANLVVVIGVMVRVMTLNYPQVGSDYKLALPSLLDSALYFKLNGLGIQWYTPSFGGGLPAFPDPNNVLFSLWTALTLLVQPFQAVIIAAIFYIGLGGFAAYLFLRRILKLNWPAAILGAVFFSANGFMVQRLDVGHLAYGAFPLLAVFLLVTLDPSLPLGIATLLFSLLVALFVQQAGYFLIIVFALSLMIVFPLLYIYRPGTVSWKRIAAIIALGGGLALLMSLAKFAAVYAFTRYFSRQVTDDYQVSLGQGLLGLVMQLAGTMSLEPLLALIRIQSSYLQNLMIGITGAPYGYWEFDMSLSPVVFLILIAGIYRFIRKPKGRAAWFMPDRRWLAWILLAFFTWLTIEFTLAKGLVYPLLQKLPLLSSLHVNVRFAAAFILPLALCAAIIYDRWSAKLSGRKMWLLFLVVDLLTLLPLTTYFQLGNDLEDRNFDLTQSGEVFNQIQSGDPLTVTGIVSGKDNMEALFLHESNLQPYDPIFGYYLEDFYPEIHVGPILDVSGSYYNMTNPSGYVFPALNGTRPFERIPVSQTVELMQFVSHKQPDWKIPLYQQVLDWVSGLSFGSVILLLVIFGIRKWMPQNRSGGGPVV